MRLRRDLKLYIEAELRDFDDTLRSIGEERNELIMSSPVHDNNGGKSYDIGNPTESKAFKIMTNKRIKRMEDTVRAISRVIDNLPEDKLRLVELKYWTTPQTRTDEGIAQEICCDRRTLYRWVDGIILAIAKEFGLVD